VDTTTELRINRDIKVLVTLKGLAVHLIFVVFGQQPALDPIELSRTEAIQVGRDIAKNGSSNRIPIAFEPGDARAFGEWLVKICERPSFESS
jgi:hypothetical protein